MNIHTLAKIRKAIPDGTATSRSHVERSTGIHYYVVERAFQILEERGEISRVETTTGVQLYMKTALTEATDDP